MSFDSLGLRAELVRAVVTAGYKTPTPIQAQAIPLILNRHDLLAGAQTGTGKTAGFTLPLLQILSAAPKPRNEGRPATGPRAVRALILVPTRELAMQVEESVRAYGKYLPRTSSAAVFGGVPIGRQITAFRKGVDVLVATPGRLQDHVARKTVDLSRVEILVLDEADRMLDMGFIRPIREILRLLPSRRQTLLFSATLSGEIQTLAVEFLHSPEHVQVAQRSAAPELVAQVIHPVDRTRKRELLSHKIKSGGWKQVLVFTRTKHGANRLSQQLKLDGISALAIHGNKTQGARTQALGAFKSGKVRVLVATDIAARGLDIDQLPHVVNYELPHVAEDYVHRIGRTGRAGKEGTAVSLVCVDEHQLLHGIERLLRRELPREITRGYEPDPNIRPVPIKNGRPAAAGNTMRRGAPKGNRSAKPRAERSRNGKAQPRGNRPGSRPENRTGTDTRDGGRRGAAESGRVAGSRYDTRGRGAAPGGSKGRPPRRSQAPSRRRRTGRRGSTSV